MQELPVPVPSAPSTPVPAGLHKVVVAAHPAIFVGNRVLWKTIRGARITRRKVTVCTPTSFTHGNVPSNDVRSGFFLIEQFYDEATGASSFRS